MWLEVLSAFVARQLASQSSPAQDDVMERILRCRGEWPCGLRAVALRLRDQPSSATTLRAVPALSGRSPLARSRLTRRGSASAEWCLRNRGRYLPLWWPIRFRLMVILIPIRFTSRRRFSRMARVPGSIGGLFMMTNSP